MVATIINQWRPLFIINLYRCLLSSIFLGLLFFNIELTPFSGLNPQLFSQANGFYFVFSLFCFFSIYRQWPTFSLQINLQLFVDIVVTIVLMHASGGVTSGVGFLIFVPVVFGCFFLPRLLAYFFAALASLLILFDQFYLFLYFEQPLNYPPAGILGIMLFATVLLTKSMMERIEDTEARAMRIGEDLQGMEKLAGFVMQRLKTPVFIVHRDGKIKIKNDSATQLCQRVSELAINKLEELSPQLQQQFVHWKQDSEYHPPSFELANNTIELLAHFTLIQKNSQSDAIVFLEDISTLKQQAQQQKLASLGRLTASIAHEFRNPLSAISHAGELLAESDLIAEQDKRLTQIIEKQSQRLNKIIDTILNLSRQQQLNPEEINLTQWLDNYLAEQIQFSQVELVSYQEKEMKINFDPHHLRQILNNLIQNALEHSLRNPQEELLETVKIELNLERKYLEVINRGEKISKQHESHIFEPFYTSKSQGTGIGLYLAKELTNHNQSQLSFFNQSNHVHFRLQFNLKTSVGSISRCIF